MAHRPYVELLWWQGCPSTGAVRAILRGALADAGLSEEAFREREVTDHAQAQREGFPGSPTIRVDGRDVEPTDAPPSLGCRVYRRADGHPSPLPDRDRIVAALAKRVAA
ncbi:MAG: DF family (seleno)protein [Solirubrobacterales bacterium]